MKRFIVLALMLLSFGLIQANAAEFRPIDCPFNQPGSYAIECGYVTVPADHTVPDGATIQLAVAVIHSNNPDKAPDPVLYLEGGPGGAPVVNAPTIHLSNPFLGLALQNRDVILVDQRGMGLSLPAFYCTPFRSVEDAFASDYASLFMERMPSCPEQFEAQGIDWRLFTTEQNALDLAMVGEALGYEQVNLQGSSYGTDLGLIILREAPEVVRSAILDSVLIPAAQIFAESAWAFDASFAQLERYCAEDLACKLAYPNLRETFLSSYERLSASPDSLTVAGREIAVTAGFFAGRVRYMLASRETARLVPAFIVGVANRDYDVVREFVEQVVSSELTKLPNQALYMTMVCPQAKTSLEAIESASQDYAAPFRKGGFSGDDLALCQAWGEPLPFDRTMPVTDVPVLLLSGELDPLTPPEWSALAAEGLSNSTRVVMPNTGHIVLEGECGQRIALAFLDNPDQTPDTSCTSDVAAISFILQTTVTRFPIQVATALLTIGAVFGLGQMAFYGLRGLKRTAWWASFRKMGYFPLLSLVILILLLLTKAQILPESFVTIGIVQSMVPLLMALQVAAVFAPSEEPSLEVQLAAPRSIIWMLAERIFVVILVYSAIAFLGIGLTLWLDPEQNLPVLFLGWLPPALFLSGIGIYVTVRSRMMALGVLLIGFLWFIFALFAPMFLPGQNFPAPFHLIQPFVWPMHVHASLNELAPQDFWLNRLFLTVGGIGLMLLSAYSLRDSEELLLGMKARKASGKKTEMSFKRELKPNLSLQPVMVQIQPLSQMLGIIRYEFLMRWRTRAIKVFVLAPLVLTVMFLWAMTDLTTIFPNLGNLSLYPPEATALIKGEMLVVVVSAIFFVPAFYMFPVLVTDSFPSDKRLGVDEMVNALPLSYLVRLVGRMLGNALAGIAGLSLALLIVALLWLLRYGSYAIEPLVDYLIGVVMASSLMTAGAVLLGASQPTSRRAVALAISLLILPEFFQSFDLVNLIQPSRSKFLLLYSMQAMHSVAAYPPAPHQMLAFSMDYLQLLATSGILLLLVGFVIWAWQRWKS
jgi:pimeloyl-ACP methyl ester carboxylesterase